MCKQFVRNDFRSELTPHAQQSEVLISWISCTWKVATAKEPFGAATFLLVYPVLRELTIRPYTLLIPTSFQVVIVPSGGQAKSEYTTTQVIIYDQLEFERLTVVLNSTVKSIYIWNLLSVLSQLLRDKLDIWTATLHKQCEQQLVEQFGYLR